MGLNSFVVDIGKTMFNTSSFTTQTINKNAEKNHRQKFYCQCGYNFEFQGKIKRSVAYPHENAREYGHANELEIIQCPQCQLKYPKDLKVHLLEVDIPKLITIEFKCKESNNSIHLIKNRIYIKYNSVEDKLENIIITDGLFLTKNTKLISLIFDNSDLQDESYNASCKLPIMENNKNYHELELANLHYINQFFGYKRNIEYSNLEEAFLFLLKLEPFVNELDIIKNIKHIQVFYNSHKIYSEKKTIGQTNIETEEFYQFCDNGFEEGIIEKVPLVYGEYLESLAELSRLYCAIINFSHITTILLTKGHVFLDEFLKSKMVHSTSEYIYQAATYPVKIMEVSLNETLLEENISVELTDFKLSNIIYKHIRTPEDLELLLKVFKTKFLSKIDIENLFQLYPADDVYEVFFILTRLESDLKINIKHVRHLLNHKYYNDFLNDSFIENYSDTLKSLDQILENQQKVRDYLKVKKNKLSKEMIKSFNEYLSIRESTFFEIRTAKELKRKHDDLSIIHAIFVDTEKSDAFIKALEGYEYLNTELNNITFNIISTVHEIHREHLVMDHCIQVYIDRVLSNIFIPVRVYDKISRERATLGITIDKNKLIFNQLKGFENSRATKFLIDTVLEYCKKNNISINSNQTFFVDLQSDISEEKKMPDYLSNEEVERIRNLSVDKQITKENAGISAQQAQAIIERFKNKNN